MQDILDIRNTLNGAVKSVKPLLRRGAKRYVCHQKLKRAHVHSATTNARGCTTETLLHMKRRAEARYVVLLVCMRILQATDQRDIIYSSLGSPLADCDHGGVMVPTKCREPMSSLQTRWRRIAHVGAAMAFVREPHRSTDSAYLYVRIPPES